MISCSRCYDVKQPGASPRLINMENYPRLWSSRARASCDYLLRSTLHKIEWQQRIRAQSIDLDTSGIRNLNEILTKILRTNEFNYHHEYYER